MVELKNNSKTANGYKNGKVVLFFDGKYYFTIINNKMYIYSNKESLLQDLKPDTSENEIHNSEY